MPRGKKFTAEQIIGKLREAEVGLARGKTAPEPEVVRKRGVTEQTGVKTLSVEPGSPWENGYIERLNGKLRDELLAHEVVDTLLEAKVLIEHRRKDYNTIRPHSSLGYRPPAPEWRLPLPARFGYAAASGQGRSLGRATLVIDAGSVHGGRSTPEAGPAERHHLDRGRDQVVLQLGVAARCPARSGRAERRTRGCDRGRQDREVAAVGWRSGQAGDAGGWRLP